MNIILDIILLVIVALSIWYGYKRGLIGSILSILAIIVALIAGSSLSANYAFEAVPVLEPFLNGYVDSQKTRDTVLEKMGYGNTDLSLDDVLASDSSLRYDYAVLCMEELGFHEDRAECRHHHSLRYHHLCGRADHLLPSDSDHSGCHQQYRQSCDSASGQSRAP